MTGTPSGRHDARGMMCAGLDTSPGARFVQERLALFGKTVFLISLAFFVVGNGILFLGTGLPGERYLLAPINLAHAAGTLIMGALWFVAGRRPWSIPILGVLDSVALVACATAWAFMGASSKGDSDALAALLAMNITTVTRAILIPSTGKRTFWLTSIACIPIIVVIAMWDTPAPPPDMPVSMLVMRLGMISSVVLWLGAGVAVSSVATRTIYGLRKEVKQATDVGQYMLEERIGSGGMGEVWRARHRLLIRPAAVKLVRPAALGSSPATNPGLLYRRFEREARATASLRSPHTVQLYDFGVTEEGTLYYVMELLDGLDLDSLVKRFGPMPAERAVHVLEQLCASLEEAHQNGLVHRDIKPANVVVSRVGAAWDFVKVLDFGLVKLAGTRPESNESLKLTAAGDASGTPAFMAPEVAVGEGDTDHRVDLYAVGCIAYWLLTGKLVFEAATAMKVMYAHAHNPPAPPSTRVELPIPPALEALVMRCLEKDPGKRPQSAAELRGALHALGLSAAWTAERAERWWSVHAPAATSSVRPAADILLSHEARPLRAAPHARG